MHSTILTDFNAFRDRAHKASHDAGWWSASERYFTGLDSPDPDRLNIPTKLCLVHSEIDEAYTGYLAATWDEHLPEWPNALIEIGDTAIRVGDLAGYLEIDMDSSIDMVRAFDQEFNDFLEAAELRLVRNHSPVTVTEVFMKMHAVTSDAMEGFRKSTMDNVVPNVSALVTNLARLVLLLDFIAHMNDWDLDGAVDAKMAFNAVREDHKAETRALTNGKKF